MRAKLYFLFIIATIFSCEDHEFLTENQIEQNLSKNSLALKTTNANGNLPMILPDNFIWGVNGHPLTQAAYRDGGSTIEMQIDLLNEHLFSYYRMDISTDSLGQIKFPYQRDKFSELINKLPNNIKILPVLTFAAFDFQFSEEELYQRAKIQAEGFMGYYQQYFDYIEIGNEEDNKAIKGSNYIGDNINHYDLTKLTKIAAYLKGMSDGIKEINNSKQIIINNGGPGHSGYHDFLDNYLYSGSAIEYDIVGLHWYDYNQNIVSLAENYTKTRLWITESNKHSGSFNNSESLQADIVNDMINQLHNQSKIEAYFLYELYNEPAFGDDSEAHYGIVKWETQYSIFSYKPVSEVIKFKIEESTFGIEDYVYLFYEHVNLSQPDIIGLNYWTNLLEENRNKLLFLTSILPERSYELFVKEQYENLLNRSADSEDLTYWVNRMKSGFSRENLILEFCIGTEFWNKSGQNNNGFIKRLYLKLLGRTVDNPSLTYWTGELNNGATKASVVDRIMNENEYLKIFVNAQYDILYKRKGDLVGVDFWVNRMKNGLNQQSLIIEFLLSEEFWEKSIIKGYERKNPYPFSNN